MNGRYLRFDTCARVDSFSGERCESEGTREQGSERKGEGGRVRGEGRGREGKRGREREQGIEGKGDLGLEGASELDRGAARRHLALVWCLCLRVEG